jgi:hypothetical protein
MKQPQLDEQGALPHDHDEILNSDNLIRYIKPHIHAQFSNGTWRVSSAAFSPSSPPSNPRSTVSVDIESLLLASGKKLPYRCIKPDGVVSISASDVRQLGLKVGWDPEPDNNCHGAIWGIGNNKSKRAKLAAAATLVVEPIA